MPTWRKNVPPGEQMNNIMLILNNIIPDGIEQFQMRYALLQLIRDHQPIGRRGLTGLSIYSERSVRSTVDLLSKQGLIQISSSGMTITEQGTTVLEELYVMFGSIHALTELEEKVKTILGAKEVVIVSGDVDVDKSVKGRLGRAGAELIAGLVEDGDTIAMTGGSTIAMMVEKMPLKRVDKQGLTVIPARGSIGTKMEFQASTLAVELAKKMNATYEVLHIPDNLSQASIETIRLEPPIEKTLQKMAKSDMIILGVGEAQKMAKRRRESETVVKLLEKKGAVAEAFRYYFDKNGRVVYSMSNIGLDLEDAMAIPKCIVLAGGASKATALMATKMLLQESYLVIDEGVANALINFQK